MARSSAIILSILLRFVSKFSGAVFFILIPFIAESFEEANSSAQSLIPIFLFGCAISQFFVGSLADAFGKRRVLLLLLGCYFMGSCLCAFSHSLLPLQVGVLTVALGVGAIAGVGNTLIFDGYSDASKAAKALSLSSVLVIWAPALAMNLGASVAQWDWRYFFVVQAILGMVLWGITWRDVPTAVKTNTAVSSRLLHSLRGYFEILGNREYRVIATQMCLAGGGIVVFYTAGLPHLQAVFGTSVAAVGWVPIIVVAANSLGRVIAGSLPQSVSTAGLSTAGLFLCSCSSIALLVLSLSTDHSLLILSPMTTYIVGVGLMFSSQRVQLMQLSQGKTSTSESLLGILMALSGALISGTATVLGNWLPAPLLVGVMLVTMLTSGLFYAYFSRSLAVAAGFLRNSGTSMSQA